MTTQPDPRCAWCDAPAIPATLETDDPACPGHHVAAPRPGRRINWWPIIGLAWALGVAWMWWNPS